MKNKLTTLLAIALPSSSVLTAQVISAATQPNILFIMTDQQMVGELSCEGNPYVKTPAIDSLAARGVRFEKSYCTYPVCSPSRASLVTSRMPHEMKIYSNTDDPGIPSSMVTMGDIFRAAGYQTAWAGKWHVPVAYPGFLSGPRATIPGFDVLPLEGPGHRSNKDTAPGLGSDPVATAAAIKFLQQPHTKPFLLTVSILNPHDICEYPKAPQHFPKPDPEAVLPPLPANFSATKDEPSVLQTRHARDLKPESEVAGWGEKEWRTYRWVYDRLTETADGLIGQVLDALEQSGQAENTIIVFTSDHGEMNGAHKLRTKMYLYEEAVAVPLIICLPGKSTQPLVVKSTHLVSSGLDILPTLCDYAGVKVPSDAAFEGLSLRPLIEQKPAAWRKYLVVEMGGANAARMLRTDRYKYIVYATGENPEQLFDLQADPGETNNLAGASASQAVLDEHRRLLKEWMAQTKDDTFGKKSGSSSSGKAKGKNKKSATAPAEDSE